MYNGMYGSPFPKLNPRVQYKTALERAGFDVNRGASPVDGEGQDTVDQRSVSVSAQMSKSRMSLPHGVAHEQRLNSMPVKLNNATPNTAKNNIPQSKPIIQPQPIPRVRVTAASSISSHGNGLGQGPYGTYPNNNNQAYPQNNMMNNNNNNFPTYAQNNMTNNYNNNNNPVYHHNNYANNNNNPYPVKNESQPGANPYNTQNGSTFNFENPGNEHQPLQPQAEEDMNPIEKSFNMLTQNDTQSEITSFHQQNDTISSSNASNRYSKQSYGLNSIQKEPNRFSEQSEDFDTSNLEHIQVKSTNFQPKDKIMNPDISFNRDSNVPSLNFAPNDNLHISMHPDDETIPLAWDNGKSEIKPQSIEIPIIKTTHHDDGEETDIQSPVTESNTNMNVESLIAQLDDVSFSRNEQLDPRGALAAGNDSRLKKSSAYMSGFPKDHPALVKPLLNTDSIYDPNFNPYNRPPGVDSPSPPPLPQNIYPNKDDNESMVSPVKVQDENNGDSSSLKINTDIIDNDPNSTIGATPTFYKFNHDMNQSFYSSSTSLLLPKSGQSPVATISSRPATANQSPSKQRIPAMKFPPGEGPCRTCGLEIVGKGVFSKKQDELSGQWHKKCFKCTECDIKFNKSTPCYILNDMPYCQQHYHEKNNSICKICHQFIEGECLENDKKERFHVNCLTCFICHEPITQDYFIFNDEIPLCVNHDMDALIADGLALPNDEGESHLSTKENKVSKRRTRLINFQENEGN